MKKSKHILIIDDDPAISRFVGFCLEQQGFRVSMAHDGEQGLRLAKEHLPDLVLLDLSLPVLSGEAVCREIKHSYDRKLRDIPLVILSAKATDVDQVVGMAMGASAYFAKPFQIGEVVRKIREILEPPLSIKPINEDPDGQAARREAA